MVRPGAYGQVGNHDAGKGKTGIQEYHVLYPVPQRERDVNPSLTQNDGYWVMRMRHPAMCSLVKWLLLITGLLALPGSGTAPVAPKPKDYLYYVQTFASTLLNKGTGPVRFAENCTVVRRNGCP